MFNWLKTLFKGKDNSRYIDAEKGFTLKLRDNDHYTLEYITNSYTILMDVDWLIDGKQIVCLYHEHLTVRPQGIKFTREEFNTIAENISHALSKWQPSAELETELPSKK